MNIHPILIMYLSSLREEEGRVLKDLEAFIYFIKLKIMFFGAKEEYGHTFQVFLKAEEYFDSLYCGNCGRTPMRWMQVGKLLQSRMMSTSRSPTTQVDLTCFVNCGEDSAEIMLGRAFVGTLEQREWAATKIMGRSCLVPKKSEQLECVCVLCQPLLNAR